jgi:iron(III) transport system substrate-binding protein
MKRVILIGFMALSFMVPLWAGGTSDASTAEKEPTELTVWTAAAEDVGEALVAAFSKHHPDIKVNLIRLGSGELVTRLNAEQPRPQGDILCGIAKEAFDGNIDLFSPYKSANHGYIPETVRDKGEQPKYYGFSMPLQAFIINTRLLTPDQYPKTWKDLANPKYKGEIILANPALSGSAYSQIYQIFKLYGDETLKVLADNAVFTASSGTVPESVARGEYAIGVTGEANIADYIQRGSPVAYVYPLDGTGARFDASGIIKNGPNPKSAELFMDFLTSREAYTIVLEVGSGRVVAPDLPGPGPLPSLSDIKLVDYDAIEAANIREELTSRFSDWIK